MTKTPTKRNLIFLDFETYYDRDYSLRKISTPEYILDPRFEMQMAAVQVNGGPHEIVEGPDFPKWIAQFDPAVTTTVTFNALFDNSILAWRYGWIPHTMLDAMAMARTLLGHELTSFSLKNVADYMNLGAKGTTLANVMGMSAAQIKAAGLWPAFTQYCLQDNFLCEQIFWRLVPDMPAAERRLMDLTLRCCVEPAFVVDKQLLGNHLKDVRVAKADLLSAAANVDPKIIMSSAKFQTALEQLGVEVETKVSPTTGKETPCFAKTDEFMEKLLDSPDPTISAMAAARIGLKSTLEETRSEKLLAIANLNWDTVAARINLTQAAHGLPSLPIGSMPVPLRYGGAHTHRLSGEWGMNMQNMPTVRGSKGKSKLRQSLTAPPGMTVVTCDLSQIEARLVAWITGCGKLVDEFANKKDPYSLLATEIFGRPINRKLKSDEIEGFIGKTGILGLGYGCGKDNFNTMVTRTARSMGIDISLKYNKGVGDRAVDAYRKRYPEIPRAWRILDQAIASAWLSGASDFKFGPCTISYGKVTLPSGLTLSFADPKQYNSFETGHTEHTYRYGKFRHKLYGAKLLENIVQALARIVVMNAALRLKAKGYRFVLQAHDELVFIVPNENLAIAKQTILHEMIQRPSWALDAPIDAELGEGASYGEAK